MNLHLKKLGFKNMRTISYLHRGCANVNSKLEGFVWEKSGLTMYMKDMRPPEDWPLLMTLFFSFLGGVFGLYDGRMDSLITQSAEGTKQVFHWGDINDPLPC